MDQSHSLPRLLTNRFSCPTGEQPQATSTCLGAQDAPGACGVGCEQLGGDAPRLQQLWSTDHHTPGTVSKQQLEAKVKISCIRIMTEMLEALGSSHLHISDKTALGVTGCTQISI